VSDDALWELIAGRLQGVLATIARDGRPQMSNILYAYDAETRTAKVSVTADRAKAKNLARDGRGTLYVAGDNFYAYAVADAAVSLSAVAAAPGDDACKELLEVHTRLMGEQDPETFDQQMIEHQRLVARLRLDHVYGLVVSAV
jgi:PPOX class probable F420-dependent enzyme